MRPEKNQNPPLFREVLKIVQGRKKTPDELKTGRSHHKKVEHLYIPPLSGEAEEKFLSNDLETRVQNAYKLLASKKVLTECDEELFTRYAAHVRFAHEAEKLIRENGLLTPDENGVLRKNPAMQIFRDNSIAAMKFESELGLTPAARARLARPENDIAEDEYNEFRKI